MLVTKVSAVASDDTADTVDPFTFALTSSLAATI